MEQQRTDTEGLGGILIGLLAIAAVLASIAVVLWQTYIYLRYGAWPPLSLLDVLHYLQVSWSFNPKDWIGLQKALNWFPLSGGLFLLGLLLSWITPSDV